MELSWAESFPTSSRRGYSLMVPARLSRWTLGAGRLAVVCRRAVSSLLRHPPDRPLPRRQVPEPRRPLVGTRHLQDTALVEEEVADNLEPSGQPRPETHRAMVQWLRGDT